MSDKKVYKIFHSYDIGNQSIFISSENDPAEHAGYLQVAAEDLFSPEATVTNLGIASILVSKYGCQHHYETPDAIDVDMYAVRDNQTVKRLDVFDDPDWPKLKALLEPHIAS